MLQAHQFTAIYARYDAIGQHTLGLRNLMIDMGWEVTTFAQQSYQDTDITVLNYQTHAEHPDPDIAIYHLSTTSAVSDYLLELKTPLVLNYHNITPGMFFAGWDTNLANDLERARHILRSLAHTATAGIADSEYNAAELMEHGIGKIHIVPPLYATPIANTPSSPNNTTTLDSTPKLLFVGRLAPNKCIEALLGCCAMLKTKWPEVSLTLIGNPMIPRYTKALENYTQELAITANVRFLGTVSTQIRNTEYAAANVYVSASKHEGFCVPLLEAMQMGLPIVAHAAAAVPETVQDAGVLLKTNDALCLASAVQRVCVDTGLRAELIAKGHARAKQFNSTQTQQRMIQALHKIAAQVA